MIPVATKHARKLRLTGKDNGSGNAHVAQKGCYRWATVVLHFTSCTVILKPEQVSVSAVVERQRKYLQNEDLCDRSIPISQRSLFWKSC
jgi:hypothetical protein